eukprot:161062-Rhodomonas_salina.1
MTMFTGVRINVVSQRTQSMRTNGVPRRIWPCSFNVFATPSWCAKCKPETENENPVSNLLVRACPEGAVLLRTLSKALPVLGRTPVLSSCSRGIARAMDARSNECRDPATCLLWRFVLDHDRDDENAATHGSDIKAVTKKVKTVEARISSYCTRFQQALEFGREKQWAGKSARSALQRKATPPCEMIFNRVILLQLPAVLTPVLKDYDDT